MQVLHRTVSSVSSSSGQPGTQLTVVPAAVLQGDYYEAVAKAVDVKRKELVACFPKDAGLDEACFKISYDILIVGVSAALTAVVVQAPVAAAPWAAEAGGGKCSGSVVHLQPKLFIST
jgi:hypothetical protein